jgi:hypothetical protein
MSGRFSKARAIQNIHLRAVAFDQKRRKIQQSADERVVMIDEFVPG